MRYSVLNFKWTNEKGNIVKEYYIFDNVKKEPVAGDFFSYKQALNYIKNTLK